jgi:glycosyltransferase involved in cell wall biosynthesis
MLANSAKLTLHFWRQSLPASPALDRPREGEKVTVVIPTLNEAESIGGVIAALRRHLVDQIIVADGGSTDGTLQIARRAGAEVIVVGPGYGRACLAGAEAATDADVLVFMDGPTIRARSGK